VVELKETRTSKRRLDLTPEAFELLLARLDPDREEAAQKYEQIRKALHAFFEHHGSLCVAEHTDSTFDEVARSLARGKDIYLEDPAGYFYGVARNILRRYRRENISKFVPLEDIGVASLLSSELARSFDDEKASSDQRHRLDCLDECLTALPEEQQRFILQYYGGETAVKIRNRKELAVDLGVSIAALRVRALRLRDRLEECVIQCLGSIEVS